MDWFVVLFRFAVVFCIALVFGLERQKAHKPIGFGTFIFVATGACGLAILGETLLPSNPLPLLSAIVTGIGFLGAGALIKTTDKVFGFTSAATIWIFAIIGLVIGTGNYFIGIVIYATVWIVVFVDKALEARGIGSYQKKLVLVTNKNTTSDELVSVLGTAKYKLVNIDVDKTKNTTTLTLYVEGAKTNINQIPRTLSKTAWVQSFKME